MRIKEHDPIQRSIDELALEMLGLDDWKPRLDEIYDAVAEETRSHAQNPRNLKKTT
jgi:hypothetical protein